MKWYENWLIPYLGASKKHIFDTGYCLKFGDRSVCGQVAIDKTFLAAQKPGLPFCPKCKLCENRVEKWINNSGQVEVEQRIW